MIRFLTHESQALPCPRPRGRSGGCHLACRFCSCASLLALSPVIAIPTSHLPPPKTRLQVRLGSVCFLGVCVAFLGSRLAGVLTFCPSPRSARPRHPGGDSRLKNWMEEAGELPWTSAPSGRSPGISCPPGAPRLPPGLG